MFVPLSSRRLATFGVLSYQKRGLIVMWNSGRTALRQSSLLSRPGKGSQHIHKQQNVALLRRKQFTTSGNPKEKVTKQTDKVQQQAPKETTFLQRFLGPKEIPPRGTLKWYGEMLLLCTVFAITGSSTMVLVRPAMTDILGLKGSLKDGPWSYRICSIVIMTPLYAVLLVCVGTVFGRHFYFRHFAVKMFSRFGIPPELMDKNFHQTAKNFRKY